jgi:hypothetical protein
MVRLDQRCVAFCGYSYFVALHGLLRRMNLKDIGVYSSRAFERRLDEF